MIRFITLLILTLWPLSSMAAGGAGVPLDKINIDLHNKASLQRGAQVYTNYCLGCHSAKYMRYERVAEDLGIPNDLMLENLVFASSPRIGDPMTNAMAVGDSSQWFGVAPPDLSLVARLRSPDWLYTYLRSFYADPSRPWGVNNKVFPDVGMPHVLEQLQGLPRKTCKQVPVYTASGTIKQDPLTGDPYTEENCDIIEAEPGAGTLMPAEYDQLVYDLVNFLTYIAEPARLDRQRMGVWVLLFLAVLLVFSYLLKREYWKAIKH
jgi:ubiquinol-cytochrome c reductase cytochrome c1 subunit